MKTPLYKTTIVIWSRGDLSHLDLVDVAEEAEGGRAYLSRFTTEARGATWANPDWEETDVFDHENEPTVTCVMCGQQADARTAHLHQGQWIGDACCWDERPRRELDSGCGHTTEGVVPW
jgi:hypothetical protein